MINSNFYNTQPSGFYHIHSSGEKASRFIISNDDFEAAFNLIGVCAAEFRQIRILAFSLEDTHLHMLAHGQKPDCEAFTNNFKRIYTRHVATQRGSIEGVDLDFNIIPINENEHLINVASYVILQPTKDGKHIMPYDYKWGTGSLYFRTGNHISIWRNNNGKIENTKRISDLTGTERHIILHTKKDKIPGDWLVSNGILLPENYVDVKGFENIYRTHNCFRVFSAMSGSKIQEVNNRIAEYAGVNLEDNEAREKAVALCREHFGTGDARRIPPQKRLELAILLRKEYHLSTRQLATLVHLPEAEIRKYI